MSESILQRVINKVGLQKLYSSLTDEDKYRLLKLWEAMARPEQLPPVGDWTYWLLMAGRGFGKTRSASEFVRKKVKEGSRHIALVGETVSETRKVMVQSPKSGILAVSSIYDFDNEGNYMGIPMYEPSKRELTWANGAKATTYSAENYEQLRGPEHDLAWADEPAKWKNRIKAWDNLCFGLRIGKNPQCILSTTPRPVDLIKELVKDSIETPNEVKISRGSTYDNKSNLAPAFYNKIIKKYEGTRLGRQEINAELLTDNPDSLFRRDLIDKYRVTEAPEDLVGVVVAIDPAATSNEESDDTGIGVVAKDFDDHYYVLADRTCHERPDGWAKRAIFAYDEFEADRVVAETNNGGEMVESVIRNITWPEGSIQTKGEDVAYESVHATRGKAIRAQPVSSLYEQGRVHHVGEFPELEDQMCEWAPGEKSPDRMDWLVWGVTSLMEDMVPGVRSV